MGKIKDFKKYISERQNGQYELVGGNPQKVEDQIIINCKKCNQQFETTSFLFRQRKTCYCSGLGLPITFEQFKKRANEIYKNKYEYYEDGYENLNSSIKAKCSKHGDFIIKNCGYHIHKGKAIGCPQCGRESYIKNTSLPFSEFLERCKAKHGDKYMYVEDSYKGIAGSITFFCKKHGKQTQICQHHLGGYGCAECGQEKTANSVRRNGTDILTELNNIRPNWTFMFDPKKYKSRKQRIKMECDQGHTFKRAIGTQLALNHNCPMCSNKVPNALVELLEHLGVDENEYELNYRKSKYEIDLFFPKLNKGIEYHGLLFHCDSMNSVFRSVKKDYHIKKHNHYSEKGLKVVQVFEDEYMYKKETLFKMMNNFIFPDSRKEIKIVEVEYKIISNRKANMFFNDNFITHKKQEYDKCYGGFIKNDLIFVCAVKGDEVFFQTHLDYKTSNEVIKQCLSFFNKAEYIFNVDRRYESYYENMVQNLNAEIISLTNIKDYYFKSVEKIRFTKDELADIGLFNEKDYIDNGYFRTWDCGDMRIKMFNYY